MDQTYKRSFLITLVLLFLLPLFFIPGGALDLDVAKLVLLTLGVIVAVLLFLSETWRKGELNIPWHPFVLIVALLPLVYFLSALLSTPSSLSLFGYNFEVGTFGYMVLGSTLLILISMVFTDTSRVLQALAVFSASFSLIVIFTAIKIFSGGFPVWGTFFGTAGNPIGRWTDLAVALGLLSVFSILVLGMIPMKKSLRLLSYGVFSLSTALLAIISFSTTFIFTLGASVILFVYFSMVEKHFFNTAPTLPQASARFVLKPTFLPIILGVVSILFLINPTVSKTSGTLSDVVTNAFGVINIEVRPSFSATLSVSKAALSQSALLGTGPNTFSHDWLIHKPVDVNTTPFWGVSFPFGIGFIPTQVASTGILGTLLWIAFFAFLVLLGVKVLVKIPESRATRFALVSSFIALLYLWVASFMYAPSSTILTLAFIFSGLFLAASRQTEIIPSRTISFSRDTATKFISTFLIVLLALGSVSLSFVVVNKTLSAFYFKKAVDLSNRQDSSLEVVEAALNKAVKFAPADIHYVALSRIHFAKAQAITTNALGTPEENLAIFEGAISKSIEAARSAVALNPAGYQNWMALGMVYSFLVPEPLAVPGAYENAKVAYSEAGKRNPANPEVLLFRARLELNHSDAEAARSLIRESLVLKENYADAYLILAQIEIKENNVNEAIASAERVALLIPGNSAIYFELGLLKYSNKDYVGAANAFASAILSTPDYANAKYYLGLALAQLGRFDEAREQFEDLTVTNPDNEEVRLILEKLKAGKNPL